MTAKEIKDGTKVVTNADAELDVDETSSCQEMLALSTESMRPSPRHIEWRSYTGGSGRQLVPCTSLVRHS